MNPSPVVLPNDLITEVLSLLPVKSLLRFKCVGNDFKTLISDHVFVKLHLKRSTTRNLLFPFVKGNEMNIPEEPSIYGWLDCTIVQCPTHRLIDNSSFTLFDGLNYYLNIPACRRIVGSCNGLILLTGDFMNFKANIPGYRTLDYWFCVWNPATRKISKNFGHSRDYGPSEQLYFAFGCDDSKDTYKVVTYRYNRDDLTSKVRVLSFGDDVWRNVESFPVVPLLSNYVYMNETLNWLSIQNVRVGKYVIVSLDMRTETYSQYFLPRCLDQVSPMPSFGVLGGCISFSYSYPETDIVIWQMKQFGVEDSWTLFLKISYENLQIDYAISRLYDFHLRPLLILNDTLLLMDRKESQAILYNWRDNTVKRTNIIIGNGNPVTGTRIKLKLNWECTKDYVESLVPNF